MKHQRIGWFGGEWGAITDLRIPLNDRGVNLGDGIFETILILHGKPQLLKKHIDRFNNSAVLLGMASPPKETWLISLISEAIIKADMQQKDAILRLNWSSGNAQERGINVTTKKCDHSFWLDISPGEPNFNVVSTKISSYEQRNANSRLSSCKTFNYLQAIQAKREAQECGFDEALLLSTNGDICCGSTSNLIIKRKNQMLTPPLTSGCLPGIMRQQGINKNLIKEMRLQAKPEPEDEWLLINSLSCHPINKVNNQSINIFSTPKDFWYSLLIDQ